MRGNNSLRAEGFVWIGLGIVLCIGSAKLGLGKLNKPGSGFMPFLTGSLLGLLGLVLTLSGIILEQPKTKGENVEIPVKEIGRKKVYTFIALCMYPLLLEPLGFIIATLLLLFSLFKIMEPRKWLVPILISSLSVILSYLIFYVWLGVNFPRGIFSIG